LHFIQVGLCKNSKWIATRKMLPISHNSPEFWQLSRNCIDYFGTKDDNLGRISSHTFAFLFFYFYNFQGIAFCLAFGLRHGFIFNHIEQKCNQTHGIFIEGQLLKKQSTFNNVPPPLDSYSTPSTQTWLCPWYVCSTVRPMGFTNKQG
jgi:hypothetical protein